MQQNLVSLTSQYIHGHQFRTFWCGTKSSRIWTLLVHLSLESLWESFTSGTKMSLLDHSKSCGWSYYPSRGSSRCARSTTDVSAFQPDASTVHFRTAHPLSMRILFPMTAAFDSVHCEAYEG